MKNKLSTVILLLYSLLIVIFAFNNKMINDIVLSLASIISTDKVNEWYNIVLYLFNFIIYLGYSITLTIVCIEYFKTFKYILIYSIVLNIFVIILVTLIKSFYISINYIAILISLISVLLGISIQILVKIKQIKGGKYEE